MRSRKEAVSGMSLLWRATALLGLLCAGAASVLLPLLMVRFRWPSQSLCAIVVVASIALLGLSTFAWLMLTRRHLGALWVLLWSALGLGGLAASTLWAGADRVLTGVLLNTALATVGSQVWVGIEVMLRTGRTDLMGPPATRDVTGGTLQARRVAIRVVILTLVVAFLLNGVRYLAR